MTILLAALSLQLTRLDEAVQAVRSELSQALASGRFHTEYDSEDRMTSCKVLKSTRVPELDAAFCETQRTCLTEARPRTRKFSDCLDREQETVFASIVRERLAKN